AATQARLGCARGAGRVIGDGNGKMAAHHLRDMTITGPAIDREPLAHAWHCHGALVGDRHLACPVNPKLRGQLRGSEIRLLGEIEESFRRDRNRFHSRCSFATTVRILTCSPTVKYFSINFISFIFYRLRSSPCA